MQVKRTFYISLMILVAEVGFARDKEIEHLDTSFSRSTTISGDFDGDGQVDSMWFEKLNVEYWDSTGAAVFWNGCVIKFANKKFPPIKMDRETEGGNLMNEGDLNDDGTDEISIIYWYGQSEWYGCEVYTFRSGEWVNLIPFFNVWGIGNREDRVKIYPKKKGYVMIEENIHTDKGPGQQSRAVKMK